MSEPKKLTSATAASIARTHGLNLSDAAALNALCDTEEEAEKMAAQFETAESPEELAAKIPRAGDQG